MGCGENLRGESNHVNDVNVARARRGPADDEIYLDT
jgi:hypothetical protein